MSRFPLDLPPGVFRNGTEAQASGRYYDANLVRWVGKLLCPVGGWMQRGSTTLTGAPRAALAWRDNASAPWLAVATHSHLYVSDVLGVVSDITPLGFTSGRVNAVASGGYGSGTYGSGLYGTPRPGDTETDDATECSLDTWGQDLLFVSPDDRKIYEWTVDIMTLPTQVTNSPDCDALVVTPERFVFALGTSDPRTVDWPDQEDNTDWTPSSTNQAGRFPLQSSGRLMCGRNVKGSTLLFTDTDVHQATYVGGTLVWQFDKIGSDCGAISRQAACSFDMQCAWMAPGGKFWFYNGYVQPIPCDVQDYVQGDFNTLQASKVVATHISAHSEIEWRYCSASSTEIDRCVVWNYVTGAWNIGRAARTCGVDKGVFNYPIMVDINGVLYDHEFGFNYSGSAAPYATSGPIVLGQGDKVFNVMGLFPDDKTLGDVTATFYAKNNMDDPDVTYGPYTLSSQTDLRFGGVRRLKARFDGVAASAWRVGTPQIDISQAGGR